MTAITPLPPAPLVSDDTPTFNSKAFLWAAALNQLVTEINAEIPTIDLAVPASEIALAAANYKGAWSALTGALAIPASVSHLGSIWLLGESVANVASEVPGTSAKWLILTDYVKLTGNQTIAGVKTFSSDPVMGVSGLTGSIAAARILAALNATGSPPIYACRAWVRFNGTTGAILASGNVSGVTRNSAGDYTITFATAMPDANYSVSGCADAQSGNYTSLAVQSTANTTVNSVRVQTGYGPGVYDCTNVSVNIFR